MNYECKIIRCETEEEFRFVEIFMINRNIGWYQSEREMLSTWGPAQYPINIIIEDNAMRWTVGDFDIAQVALKGDPSFYKFLSYQQLRRQHKLKKLYGNRC